MFLRKSSLLVALMCLVFLFVAIGCEADPVEEVEPVEDPVEEVDPVEDPVEEVDPVEEEEIDYPTRAISMVVQWGAGGVTDLVGRTIAPLAEEELGRPFAISNITGGAGSVGVQHVFDQPADGYTVGMFAENPALYRVLGQSDRHFAEFEPVMVLAMTNSLVVVGPDSPFEDFEELMEYAIENPGDLLMGTDGPAGEQEVLASFFLDTLDATFQFVRYDGGAPALVATMAGEVDLTIISVAAAIEYIRSGDTIPLTVIHDEPLPELPDVAPITNFYPEMEKYLPWGPFFAVWVKKETPEQVLAKLQEAFKLAVQKPEWEKFLTDNIVNPLHLTGDEAWEHVNRFKSVTAWALYDSGEAAVSPEEFNIPRP